MIASLGTDDLVSFSDKDLCPNKGAYVEALYITVHAQGDQILLVLIDNGSALNVCPLKVASFQGYGTEDFLPSRAMVRAYDNARRKALGTMKLEVTVGPAPFMIEFQVLDIASSFNLLLGRP
ncbi:hypothetical protein Tsubulata_035174 [Turnera subulata]|uniref:Uncharacterized protein n=1 Tax=Turnera subulata TaxID=218843 RepID=A0A9Q0J8V9_9ROSI|nr:hypothetical protein Tsubulata_035174 [Turnera subulata]